MDDDWESIFIRYRQYPVTKSLQKQVHILLKFREIQRVKVSKSTILPTLFGLYVICEIRLYIDTLLKMLRKPDRIIQVSKASEHRGRTSNEGIIQCKILLNHLTFLEKGLTVILRQLLTFQAGKILQHNLRQLNN